MDDTVAWSLLAALSFLPPLAFMAWVRSRERYGREPFGAVLGVFIHGATLGVAVTLLFTGALDLSGAQASLAVAVVLIAPLVEEAAKGLGLGFVRRHIDEPEDGLVYGAAAGLGFAATETLLYGAASLMDDGIDGAFMVVAARTVSSMLLHGSSSALLGFGFAVDRIQRGVGLRLLFSYVAAVGLHAAYNFIVLSSTWLGFLGAVVMVVVVWGSLMRRLRALDAAPLL